MRRTSRGLYRNVLERNPDAAGLAHSATALSAGLSRGAAASATWNSLEHRGLEINHFYETYFHREADAGGRNFWAGLLAATSDENAVIAAMVSSAEYRALHSSDQLFITALYDDILVRPIDPDGLANWEAALRQGVSPAAIAEYLLHSSTPVRFITGSLYAGYLHRNSDAAGRQYMTDVLTSGARSPGQLAVAVLASDEYFAQAAAAATP